MASPNNRNAEACVCKGLICIYSACTPECGCRGHEEVLCLRRRINFECCSNDFAPLTLGADCSPANDHSVCNIGLGICECGLVQPRVLCGSAGHSLCLRGASALPFHKDFLDDAVCAYYFVQCLPKFVCCAPPPDCPALNMMKANYTPTIATEHMERGGDYNMVATSAQVLSVEAIGDDSNVFEIDGEGFKDEPVEASTKIV